ncbi:MAG: hypothetical protein QOE70_6044 [Chthoniobacter sp.]|jgi:peptidoglycan hydrolase-like protein with peptidoglycan-binding domain|nr:hypothetical protein [Chthoniobacter sp.]
MKRIVLLLAVGVMWASAADAEDRLRDVQTELKSQGFYYGEINGQSTNETTAAIRRYQIRNGLEVTGTLTKETIESLGIGPPSAARPPQDTPPPIVKPKPPVNLRREPSVEEKDRSFLRREEAKRLPPGQPTSPPPIADDPSVVPPPRTLEAPSADLPVIFADTPYANAPREVQESTLRRAQGLLASRGLYREQIDGAPGPATEEALLSYQRSLRLALTGRLDLETLSAMRLLPGRSAAPSEQQRRTVYRGIWIR